MSQSIIRTKKCKRCGGNLALESDVYGTYIQCIQCGASYSGEDFRVLVAEAKQQAIRARTAAGTQLPSANS